jgi:hypothetical protein
MLKILPKAAFYFALCAYQPHLFAEVPSSSPYITDVQTSYAQDPTQSTFQDVSMIGCIIRGMSPETHVGTGQYVALVDQNKCDNSSNSNSTNGTATSTTASWLTAVISVIEDPVSHALNVTGAVLSPADSGNNKGQENIQIKASIAGGPAIYPPYGKWNFSFCSSPASSSLGTCAGGSGYVNVSPSEIASYGNGGGVKAGISKYSNNGDSGYGAILNSNNNNNSTPTPGFFAFSKGLYLFETGASVTTPTAANSVCYNPSTSAVGTTFSEWQNFLYDQTTGQRLTYTNPGFFLASLASKQQIGEVSYDGVNFWNNSNGSAVDASAAQVTNLDGSKTYNVHRTPGSLRKVTTLGLVMNDLDGVPINFNFWGNNFSLGSFVGSRASLTPGTSNNLNVIGSWSQANHQFTFTAWQICSNTGCAITNFDTLITVSLADLIAAGAMNFNGWVNGTNTNYSANIAQWASSSPPSTLQPILESSIVVVQQNQVRMNPNDPSLVNLNLNCIAQTCPGFSSSGALADVSNSTNWPQTTKVTLKWGATQGAPLVTSNDQSNTLAVDWTTGNSSYQSHWYQLYTDDNLARMACSYSDSTGSHAAYCPQQVNSVANMTYYNWQSGGQWDPYVYLTESITPSTPLLINPPISLSYKVPSTIGQTASYIGQTITFQSSRPGNLGLPGHCVDALGKLVSCGSSSNWVNDVVIPTSTDGSGSVTLLDSSGHPTSTKYYVKWLNRGVNYQKLPLENCSSLASSLSQAAGVVMPSAADWDASVRDIAWPSSSTFSAKPSVQDGVNQ